MPPRASRTLTGSTQKIRKKAGITKRFTPTGLRRTGETWYGRTVGTRAMAITGHRTEAMHRHYGDPDAQEKLAIAARTWGPHLHLLGSKMTKKADQPEHQNVESQPNSGDRVWGSEGSAGPKS